MSDVEQEMCVPAHQVVPLCTSSTGCNVDRLTDVDMVQVRVRTLVRPDTTVGRPPLTIPDDFADSARLGSVDRTEEQLVTCGTASRGLRHHHVESTSTTMQ